MDKKEQDSVILEASLQTFFFDELLKVNQKFESPVSKEKIFYSSLVMDKFSQSEHFFEKDGGKIRNKVLGVKLLEASHLPRNKKREMIKDVAETSLFVCGFFSDSLNRKIVDINYYKDVGQTAYEMLDGMIPSFYDIDSFYKSVSTQFETLAQLMKVVSDSTHKNAQDITYVLTSKKVS